MNLLDFFIGVIRETLIKKNISFFSTNHYQLYITPTYKQLYNVWGYKIHLQGQINGKTRRKSSQKVIQYFEGRLKINGQGTDSHRFEHQSLPAFP